MKLFGDVNVLRGSVAWSKPFRIHVTPAVAPAEPLAPPAAQEYDEEGRLYVFRYAKTKPERYSIERDRIFDYLKRRRLPDAGQRQIRRDFRNRADFIADVRDLQTPSDPVEIEVRRRQA
jgi:hypothetical protein